MEVTKTRRLTDLYKRGQEVTVNDENGDPIVVWMQKLSPLESETMYRRSNARRAQILSLQRSDPDGMELAAIKAEVLRLDSDNLINYIANDEINSKRLAIESEYASDNGWLEDEYLQGLNDRWNDPDFQNRFINEPDDPEVVRIKEEMARFVDEAEAEIQKHLDAARKDLSYRDKDWLVDKAIDIAIRIQADSAWLLESRKCEVWMSVRDPEDKTTRYFTSRDEVDLLEDEVLVPLVTAYQQLIVDPFEGKGSRPAPTSSPPLDSQETTDTETDSGPKE